MSNDPGIFERRFVPADTVICRKGEAGSCAYLVQSGNLVVYDEYDGKVTELGKLQVGDIFGEMSLLFNEPRAASIKTVKDCNLIVITKQNFDHKLERSDKTVKAIVKMLSRRLMKTNDMLASHSGDLDALADQVKSIGNNIRENLPHNQKRTFDNTVQQKLDEFLEAVSEFKDRFAN